MKRKPNSCTGCAWSTDKGNKPCVCPDDCCFWESWTRDRKDPVRHYTARQVIKKIEKIVKCRQFNDYISACAFTRGGSSVAGQVMNGIKELRRQMRRRK